MRDNVAMTQAPHLIVPKFLSAEDHNHLLSWTLESQSAFVPARVHSGVDDKLRRALVMQDIGPFKMPLAKAASSQYRGWLTQMGLPPFDVSGIELELAAHNDGAHFTRHTDTNSHGAGFASSVERRVLLSSRTEEFYRRPTAPVLQ